MMDKVTRLATAAGPHQPGELRRRVFQAVGAVALAGVVIGSLMTASASDNERHTICRIARIGMGDTCEDRVSNLAEVATRVRFAGVLAVGQLQAPISQPQEAPRDPTNPCGSDDGRALCTCKRELLDQQNGNRLDLEPRCSAILRSGDRSSAGA